MIGRRIEKYAALHAAYLTGEYKCLWQAYSPVVTTNLRTVRQSVSSLGLVEFEGKKHWLYMPVQCFSVDGELIPIELRCVYIVSGYTAEVVNSWLDRSWEGSK